MVRIIKNNYNKEKEFECKHCKSIFGITIDDLQCDIDGDKYFKCPLCGYSIYVNQHCWFEE